MSNVTNFSPLVKGLPNWHDKYNEDFLALHQKVEGLVADNEALRAALQNKADIQRPEEHDLPLSDNVAALGQALYYKTQEEMIGVSFEIVKKDNAVFAVKEIIAQLPEGFRPGHSVYKVIQGDTNPTGNRQPIVILIDTEGRIQLTGFAVNQLNTDFSRIELVTGYLFFLAA